jgi:hypothetical protein
MSDARIDRRAFVGAAMATALVSGVAHAQSELTLDGTWEGELTAISGSGISPPPRHFGVVRLEIFRRNARVFMDGDEVKPGAFQIERNGSNAVISAIESDPSSAQGAGWVETWAFIVTLGDADTLIVNYVRVVNNNNMAASEDGARFSQIRTGQLRRLHV